MKKLKILCISDTHGKHKELIIDTKGTDIIIHAGDESNNSSPVFNHKEAIDFFEWYSELDIPYKIFVPGNHSTAFEKGLIKKEEYPSIIFLVNEGVNIEGINIWGSPHTPTFGVGWAYNCARHKIAKYWEEIPTNTDILVTHGPPYGILDLSLNRNRLYEQTGCKALFNRIKKLSIKYHIFGHLHTNGLLYNHGTKQIGENLNTIFINASIVDDRHNVINAPITITI